MTRELSPRRFAACLVRPRSTLVLLGAVSCVALLVTDVLLERRSSASNERAALFWQRTYRRAGGRPGKLPRSLRCVASASTRVSRCEASDPDGHQTLVCGAVPSRCAPAARRGDP